MSLEDEEAMMVGVTHSPVVGMTTLCPLDQASESSVVVCLCSGASCCSAMQDTGVNLEDEEAAMVGPVGGPGSAVPAAPLPVDEPLLNPGPLLDKARPPA